MLALIVTFLSGCSDFNKPLGNGYFWLRTNYYNQIIFKDEPQKILSDEITIDTKVVDVEIHGTYIIAYRVKIDPEFNDHGDTLTSGYGYHIINMENDEVIRGLSLSELETLSIEKGFSMTYSMCRNENSRFECLKRKF